MPAFLLPAKLLLLLNLPLTFHTLFHLASLNGLTKRLIALTTPGRHGYPGTPAPLRQQYTRLPPLDKQLTMLVAFFAEAIDTARPASVIQAMHFAAQFGAAGLLLSIEGARRGNRGKAVTWTTLAGNLAQSVSFAVTAPSYFLLHLLTTTSTSVTPTATAIVVSPAFAASIPLSFVLGYIVPSIALMLPAPAVVSYDNSQIISAVWQLFPMYIAALQVVLQLVLPSFFPSLHSTSSRAPIRAAYTFGIVLAALGHIGTLSTWATHAIAPTLFARSFPSLLSVFTPAAFWPQDARRIKSVGAAAQLLLQWDEICGSLATLVWTAALLAGGMAATKRTSAVSVIGAVLGAACAVVLLGPCGAAVGMVWARDEMVFADADDEERKTK